jgi:hypothetical protein
MILQRRPSSIAVIRLLVVSATLLAACPVMSATALAASPIHFQSEALPTLKSQLQHGQVHALAFHPSSSVGHIHVSLNDGRHMTVAYVSSEQAQLLALARASNTPAVVAVAKPKAAKAAHHKLRYIAGGIVIVVIVVVAAVLLVDRRRKLGEGAGDGIADGASVPSPPGETT